MCIIIHGYVNTHSPMLGFDTQLTDHTHFVQMQWQVSNMIIY